ncbi:hypothetical protein MMC26_004496 [Xylographa opegraphella]|nr:hypothetical protein [Xylographa opegraphella]
MANLLTTTADNNRSFADEPPETPAPLFAVRALKSALFGTPALEEEDEAEEENNIQLPTIQHVSTEDFIRPLSPARTPAVSNHNHTAQQPKTEPLLSPAKGILLTPGTGATRRKTVSFGALADFNKDLTKSGLDREGELAGLTSTDSAKPGRGLQATRRREAGLRRTLFDIQGKRPESKMQAGGLQAEDQQTIEPAYKTNKLGGKAFTDSPDVTVDLKHPISRSGQHWKNEYQKDHAKSKKEMRKLIHYTQAAKSYAIKRDTEALSLNEKLKQALTRSAEMESRVSQLASQLSHSAGQKNRTPSDHVELLGELATQTANSLRYKQKAEKYRTALQAQSKLATLGNELVQSEMNNTASGELQTSVPQAKRQAHKCESTSFVEGEEILQLRNVAEMAENKAAALMKENLSLKNTLARVKQEMKAYEIRHQAREQRRKKKEEKTEAQRLALEEELAQYRTVRQQKTATIPSQNSVSRVDGSRAAPLETKTLKQHTVVGNLNKRYHKFALPEQNENSSKQSPKVFERQKLDSSTEANSLKESWNLQDIKSHSLQGSVDIWAGSVDELKSSSPRDPSLIYDESPLAELKHLLNEGHGHRVRDRSIMVKRSEKQIIDSKPMEHVVNTGPICTLPKLEQEPVPARVAVLEAGHEGVFGQDHLLPKAVPKLSEATFQVRPQASLPSQSRSNTLSRLLGNSRASSLSGRPPLPLDRAEAARKRLEQKTQR